MLRQAKTIERVQPERIDRKGDEPANKVATEHCDEPQHGEST
jgi:hypothetical protein